MAGETAYTYRDASGLARWATWLLYAQSGAALVGIWSGWQEYQLLQAFEAGTFATETAMLAAADANDTRQTIVGLTQAALALVNGVLILMWIYRANANVRALGAVRMDYTPGWSVGWYFVPFANLGVPYLAMKDIWKASARPHDPQGAETPAGYFPAWWTFWLATTISGNVAFRLSLNAETVSDFQTASIVTLASDAVRVPLCLIFPVIMAQVQRMQEALAAGQAETPLRD